MDSGEDGSVKDLYTGFSSKDTSFLSLLLLLPLPIFPLFFIKKKFPCVNKIIEM